MKFIRDNFKEIIKYTKGRAIITGYSFILTFIFIDLMGWKYWIFAMWFIPLNFVVGYLINKRAFKK